MVLKSVSTISFIVLLKYTLAQNNFRQGVLNPDQIYFDDGGRRVLPLSNTQASVPNLNNGFIQGNHGNINTGQIPNNAAQSNIYNNFGNTRTPQNDNSINNPTQTNADSNRFPDVNNFENTFNGAQIPSVNIEPPYFGSGNHADRFGDGMIGTDALNATIANLDPVSLALCDFGINVMKNVPSQNGNVVVSPFSIATLLALLQQGSLGTTQQQITEALKLTPAQSADGFKRLSEVMKKRSSNSIVNVANGLFIADGFNLNPAFARIAKNDFGSEVAPLKFSRPRVAAQKVNNWVASKTSNKIDKLLTPDSVSESTQLMLVNAVYFKGLWAVKFRAAATMPMDFHLSTGGKKTVPFMRMRRIFRTDIDRGIMSQILILPFENEQYSLVLLLPSEMTTASSVLASLTKEKLLAYQSITPKEVALELPMFTVKSDTDLYTVLQKMGIVNMFGPRAELSGIGAYREYSPQVSSALHSALLSIDEEGGVAAAATSFGVVALSYDDPSLTFKANRPFIAVVWDNEASVPLFMAKIEDPMS